MNRNGTGSRLPEAHFYDISALNLQGRIDVAAFILAFDTGTAAAVGRSRTLTESSREDATLLAELALLEAEAQAGRIDLVAEGVVGGARVRLVFDPPSGLYGGPPQSRSAWLTSLAAGEALTFTALFPGQSEYRLPSP